MEGCIHSFRPPPLYRAGLIDGRSKHPRSSLVIIEVDRCTRKTDRLETMTTKPAEHQSIGNWFGRYTVSPVNAAMIMISTNIVGIMRCQDHSHEMSEKSCSTIFALKIPR